MCSWRFWSSDRAEVSQRPLGISRSRGVVSFGDRGPGKTPAGHQGSVPPEFAWFPKGLAIQPLDRGGDSGRPLSPESYPLDAGALAGVPGTEVGPVGLRPVKFRRGPFHIAGGHGRPGCSVPELVPRRCRLAAGGGAEEGTSSGPGRDRGGRGIAAPVGLD